ncbi:MBL fold metallo-hydrolase [Acinetobacter qingfengensis]|uniref:MBL fold metallo-hydrolase n=1 Tax=Acinetobacter qingfengensis TaxID=1262585 RepID=A0A1E7R166_9GAMM|nr:MBL fold metallo-hydrolase [Acinetobacter qingfengensis]KAA8733301.1 MBL fold metallo-hydrolase [Acinetobacter qingfengensis]OEY93067.1 MBL fold metallo-hydrolase [Acinetobacter qingfengensis]
MKRILGIIGLMAAMISVADAAPLSYKIYNPQENAIFPVSSTLIMGDRNAVLVDAQFNTKDANKLVQIIKDSGKNLQYIIITAGDPDFYFGLEPIISAFPNAKVIATPKVVEHIQATKDAKQAYWFPQLKDGAPSKIYVPTVYKTSSLTLDGQRIEFKANNRYAAYLWVPSSKVIVGGVGISSGIHVWTADTQSFAARQQWQNTLKEMINLKPKVVIPGHYIGDIPTATQAIHFTSNYLNDFEHALKQSNNAQQVIENMQSKYSLLSEKDALILSAKVNMQEMQWE